MTDVWGVTYYIDGSDEGVSVIELFATEADAHAFCNRYQGRPNRRYGVTKFCIWDNERVPTAFHRTLKDHAGAFGALRDA